MRRLYYRIYFGFLIVTILLIVFAVVPDWIQATRRPPPRALVALVEHLAEELPQRGPDLAQRFDTTAERLGVDATLWAPDGEPIASTPDSVGPPRESATATHWIQRRGPPGIALPVGDGRWLALSLRHANLREGSHRWPLGLLAFAAIVAVGALPLARQITRRLERLRAGVERLGTGDLSARVPIEGHDEVADLAASFNRSAEQIERLVETQRRMLASASHELRTPLARLRVASELMAENAPEELRSEAAANIAELDALIEDLLVAARLEGAPPDRAGTRESVDLLGLAAEEAARVGAQLEGEPRVVSGDPRLLRRLLRNVLENARRHGDGSPIEVSVSGGTDQVRIEVLDRGPGIPAEDRERVFEAFYRPRRHDEGRDGGVGLGLALVREIARHHGGDAVCLERPGGGTIVRIDLARDGT